MLESQSSSSFLKTSL
ncbi:hypothetical protein CPC698_0932A, partial [Chlamydia psittaci C6/98]